MAFVSETLMSTSSLTLFQILLSLTGNIVQVPKLTGDVLEYGGYLSRTLVAVIAMIVTSPCQIVEDLPVRIGLQSWPCMIHAICISPAAAALLNPISR